MSNLPPLPPGAVLDDPAEKKPSRAKKKHTAKMPPLPAGAILDAPEATDGDTVRDGDHRLRIWGYDAPELGQPSYRPDMSTVPVGEQSRDALQDYLGQSVTFGPTVGESFGRQIGALTSGDIDLAEQLLLAGQGYAAPEYIDDPDRQFDYQHAESRARLNRQGVHEYYTDLPADYRAPGYRPPERKTIARFGDTPTPWAGLREEDANRFLAMAYDPDVPIVDAVAFARSKGALVSADEIKRSRDYYLKHGEAGGLNYTQAPAYQIDSGDGATGAGARSFFSGFAADGLDEAGAFADMLGGTEGRENVWNSDRRWADIWSNNQQQNAAILRFDENTYPGTTTGGKVAGALTSGFVIPYGAGARTVPQLAKVGAAYGGAEGFLGTDGSVAQRTIGALQAAPVGAALNAGAGKALQVAAPFVSKSARAIADRLQGRSGAKVGEVPLHGPQGTHADEWGAFPDAPPERAMAMDGEAMPSVAVEPRKRDYLDMGPVRPRPMLADPTEAQIAARAAEIRPDDVLPMPSNVVDGVEEAAAKDAGRVVEARAPHERGQLERRTVRNVMGVEVPKVGPIDLIGWVRLNNGLRDAGDKVSRGGDLKAMGLANSSRRGMDFVGQEHRFGPLINDETGMTLDDAAEAAWEAGYFPELAERPSVNEFLDALDESFNGGSGRRFLPEDLPEIEAYYAAQGERHALEQQRFEAGEPIYQDRSVPADEAQPFPPVQAYEEWPSDAIERVGNIDVTKLDTPQDIRRALKTTHNTLGGFDAATRGRITQAETERLASELNMTPEQLLSRRKGQAFNAEEALAARQILAKSGNELVNAAKRMRALGDDPGAEALATFRKAWMRHVAIQEQVSGMTAEAGRALQQFRQAADARAVRGDVLDALVRGGGGKSTLIDAADALIDAVEIGPGKFNVLAEKAAKPKWHNKIGELYINMLLSNPPTHVVNTVSNTLTSMLQIPEYALGSVIGGARRALLGKAARERILASEVGARTFGLVQGTKEGLQLFAKALRTGEADDFVTKVEGDEYRAISGIKGEIIRIPTRLLTAEDQLFKGIARRMEMNAQAVRIAHREGLNGAEREARIAELVANPTDAMLERAMDYGRYLTFQRKLGDFGQSVSRASGSNLLAKVVVPFVRTPMNLLKFATERSPAAPLLKEWRADFAAGGDRRDMAIARSLLGTGFATLIYQAALDGTLTGAVPPDPAKARLMYADGWQPYSIKIGDRYVSYSRLDPLSTTIGVAADMATLPGGLSDRQRDDMGVMLVASIMGNLASKTWLSGASAFTEALSDPGRYADNWLQRTAGAFAVPAGVAGFARSIDPVSRKRETIGEAVQARIPGMTDNLLPRRDIFGEEIVNDSLGPDFLSPFWQSKSRRDPVVAEMLRIEKSVSAPGKSYTEDGERIDYTPEQYDRYHEIAGRLTYNALLGLIGSHEYSQLDDNGKRKAAKKAIRDARETARSVINDSDYPLPARAAPVDSSRDSAPAVPPPPPGAVIDGESMGANVYRDLQEKIPGIRLTSGYRDDAYNQSLKRRGYQAADNSTHMDGDTFDALPPEGKTLGWLRREVKRNWPKAETLIHDGHLHFRIPGYFGAPALGGARAAGVVNPMMGVPPLPPGARLDVR